eukprot:symbB.v1.2.011655.t1/scaffold789.1/size230748/16
MTTERLLSGAAMLGFFVGVRSVDQLGNAFGSWGFNKAFMRNWLAHQNLPDEDMRDIPKPWNEMQLHISYKFAQAFSVIGLGVGALMSRKPNKYRKIGQAALLGSCIGAGPVGFAAWHFKSSTLSEEDIYDRAYRLRYNRNQIRVDNCFEASVQLGFLGGLIVSRGSLAAALADAGILGTTGLAGVIFYIIYSQPEKLQCCDWVFSFVGGNRYHAGKGQTLTGWTTSPSASSLRTTTRLEKFSAEPFPKVSAAT